MIDKASITTVIGGRVLIHRDQLYRGGIVSGVQQKQ